MNEQTAELVQAIHRVAEALNSPHVIIDDPVYIVANEADKKLFESYGARAALASETVRNPTRMYISRRAFYISIACVLISCLLLLATMVIML